jgi:hypothetical protein
MTDQTYEKLDPAIRAQALVGRFLQGWSCMEIAMHDALGAALQIERTKLWIICANLRFQDKTHILRTLVDVSIFPEEEKTRAKSRLRKLASRSTRRNMIAHDPFEADPNGDGVSFMTTKAKGEFEVPVIQWSIHRFDEEDRALEGYTNFLHCLEERFKQRPLQYRNYAAALRPFLVDDRAWYGPPMQRNISPALLDLLTRQPQAHPDYDQATPHVTPQTPEAPRE